MIKFLQELRHAIWVVLRLPYLIFGYGYRRFFRLGWHKLLVLAFAAVLVVSVLLTTVVEITSQPTFCGSCHLMEPYIKAWKESSHKDISCMECHAQSGITGFLETKFTAMSMLANYATGLYKRSKPWAEIEDSNCLKQGCHNTRLLDGKIDFTKGVVFDHAPHLNESRRGRKLRCTSCHSQIVQGEHISVTSSTCFLCHFKNVQEEGREQLSSCTTCHTPPTGAESIKQDIYDHADVIQAKTDCKNCHPMMWQGSGGVSRERCGTCHSSTAHLDKIDDLEFIHEWHIEKRKVECERCHNPIEHRRPLLDKEIRSNCTGCHDDKHLSMSSVYQGIGSRLLDSPQPDVMFAAGVVCVSCHKDGTTGHAIASIGEMACVPCHDQSYKRLSDDWSIGFDKQIDRLSREFKKAGVHPQLEEARQDLALLKKGGAWHNPKFADTLLTRIAIVLHEAGARPDISAMPAESKSCLVCHSSIAEIPVNLALSDFNHKKHLVQRGISCKQCHIDNKPDDARHGQIRKAEKSCTNCHHKVEAKKQENCSPCHSSSRNLYFGELPGLEPEPSPMAAMEMSCTDCHEAPLYQPPNNEFCLDCHDQDVVDHLEFVKGELVIALKKGNKKGNAVRIVVNDNGRAVHHPDLAKKVLLK